MIAENQKLFEECASQVTALIGKGKFDEAIEASKKFPVLNKAAIKAVEEIQIKKAEKIINQGYSPENLQKLNDMFANTASQTKEQMFHKLCENSNMTSFAYEMKLNEWEKKFSEYMLNSISSPYSEDSQIKKDALAHQLNECREAVRRVEDSPKAEDKPAASIQHPSQKPRPQSARLGEEKAPAKKAFFARLKDRIEQFKLDYHYSGIAGALGYREKKGDGTFLRNRFDKINEDFTHISTLDFNRYPNLSTERLDYTKIDRVILPNPKENPSLSLAGSKLKGNIDLSAYDKINLTQADLSQVKELDLSGCKDIDLRGLDLSHIKLKLPDPITGSVVLYDTKLPRLDKLNLSQAKSIGMRNTDFGKTDTVVMPANVSTGNITGWPKHIDASKCEIFNASGSDMSNVEKITPPAVRHTGKAPTSFRLHKCSLPKLKSLDLSACGKVTVTDNNMPSLEHLKINGLNSTLEKIYGNQAANLKKVEINKNYIPEIDNSSIFKTYDNIRMAVNRNQTVYRDEQIGKICPLTENQKQAIEIIQKSQHHGQGLANLWQNMSENSNNTNMIAFNSLYHKDPVSQSVLTEYNKALSQALGLKSYINMETLKYEKTPPLKQGEKVEIPPFSVAEYNKISRHAKKSNSLDKWGRPAEKPVRTVPETTKFQGR